MFFLPFVLGYRCSTLVFVTGKRFHFIFYLLIINMYLSIYNTSYKVMQLAAGRSFQLRITKDIKASIWRESRPVSSNWRM